MNESKSTSEPPVCQAPNPDLTPPKFKAPPGTWDCHIHIVGPVEKYPYVPNRSYTPAESSADDYSRVMAALRVDHAVVVQPSFYGTDNRCTQDAIASANGKWRGVAVIEPTTKESEMVALHEAGFRGVRMNLLFKGGLSAGVLEPVASLIKPFGWHLQFLLDARDLPELAPRLRRLPVPFVIDHMGHMPAALGVKHPAFETLLQLVREGCWVKLSGAYRISSESYPYNDVVPLARALVEAAPERMVWGTDWPHPAVTVPLPRDGDLLDLVPMWIPDPEIRKRVLVDNPSFLYGLATKPAAKLAENS
jgi:predicted TIM-barrel fold metal-dependent hydrolase